MPPKRYLFLLVANQSGSTVLTHQLAKCESVVGFPFSEGRDGNKFIPEGQHILKTHLPIPAVLCIANMWTEKSGYFQTPENYNWNVAKKAWLEEWHRNPKSSIPNCLFLEKSPPNVVRAAMLQLNFAASYFIIMVRNPFAVAEGVRRRNGYSIERCAHHAASILVHQTWNMDNIVPTVSLKYEGLMANPVGCADGIREMLPELHDLDFTQPVEANSLEGYAEREPQNYNKKQFSNLSTKDIDEIERVFRLPKYTEAFEKCNYKVDMSYYM